MQGTVAGSEILHHLGCKNPVNNGIPTSTGEFAGVLNHQQHHLQLDFICTIRDRLMGMKNTNHDSDQSAKWSLPFNKNSTPMQEFEVSKCWNPKSSKKSPFLENTTFLVPENLQQIFPLAIHWDATNPQTTTIEGWDRHGNGKTPSSQDAKRWWKGQLTINGRTGFIAKIWDARSYQILYL